MDDESFTIFLAWIFLLGRFFKGLITLQGRLKGIMWENIECSDNNLVYVPGIYEGRGAHLWVSASRLRDASGEIFGAIESLGIYPGAGETLSPVERNR
ncbi:MAG: hypothetical protein AB1796_00115 [Bacillota bacterium]